MRIVYVPFFASQPVMNAISASCAEQMPAGAIALVVPGIPMESPGMETGGAREAFNVLMIPSNAAPTIYASH